MDKFTKNSSNEPDGTKKHITDDEAFFQKSLITEQEYAQLLDRESIVAATFARLREICTEKRDKVDSTTFVLRRKSDLIKFINIAYDSHDFITSSHIRIEKPLPFINLPDNYVKVFIRDGPLEEYNQ
jgi:hypothetical protein